MITTMRRNQCDRIKNNARFISSSSAVPISVITLCYIFVFPIFISTATTRTLLVEASSAAGTETLVGIVGKDFILLGADSSVSQSIALTASNIDKITPLVDPFPDRRQKTKFGVKTRKSINKIQQKRRRRQQTIVAAAAGDAADSDNLIGYLKAYGTIEEFKNSGLGSDVRWVSVADNMSCMDDGGGLDVRAMAYFARRCLWERLRSRAPYRVCLLIAGMMWVDDYENADDSNDRDLYNNKIDTTPIVDEAFAFEKVQSQVRQAVGTLNKKMVTIAADEKNTEKSDHITPSNVFGSGLGQYQPYLFWLDEYGSLQKIRYGAHGHGANFLLSVLDQSYKPNLTRDEAVQLMEKCFQELRSRYVINSPAAPCIKCVDTNGVRWVQTAKVLDEDRDYEQANMLQR
mmetsp:Transcript_18810/g.21810  ORF Transcript_18810/g.21810 Transcript_18810/m.21810 type:complete len:402 (+) Transcript_18810:92-1297(+)